LTVSLFAVIVIVISTDPREVTTMAEYKCGPETDPDFFNELQMVFDKFPDAAQKYSIACMLLEKNTLRIDFEKQTGISRIEGHQIITEFRDIGDGPPTSVGNPCCEWGFGFGGRRCIRRCHALP